MRKSKRNIIELLDAIRFCGCTEIRFGTALCVILSDYRKWGNQEFVNLSNNFLIHYDHKVITDNTPQVCFVLSSYNIQRKDQTRMFENVSNLVEDKMIIQSRRNPSGETKMNLLWLLPVWYLQLGRTGLSVLQKKMIVLYMYHYYMEARYIVGRIKDRRKEIKLVSVFDDIFPIDSIVVQLCKKMGIKTSTFHHAIINGSFHYIEYRYSMSDYFLAWGRYTRDMAVRFGMPREKVRVLGALNMIDVQIPPCQNIQNKVIGVMTRNASGKKYILDNQELLELVNKFAEKYHYKYIVRYHPSDTNSYAPFINEEYCLGVSAAQNQNETIYEFMNKAEFVVCANSSGFAEALRFGKPALRYIPERERKEDVCRGISFGKIKNLEQMEEYHLEYTSGKAWEKITKIADYIFAEGDIAANYYHFYKDIEES